MLHILIIFINLFIILNFPKYGISSFYASFFSNYLSFIHTHTPIYQACELVEFLNCAPNDPLRPPSPLSSKSTIQTMKRPSQTWKSKAKNRLHQKKRREKKADMSHTHPKDSWFHVPLVCPCRVDAASLEWYNTVSSLPPLPPPPHLSLLHNISPKVKIPGNFFMTCGWYESQKLTSITAWNVTSILLTIYI